MLYWPIPKRHLERLEISLISLFSFLKVVTQLVRHFIPVSLEDKPKQYFLVSLNQGIRTRFSTGTFILQQVVSSLVINGSDQVFSKIMGASNIIHYHYQGVHGPVSLAEACQGRPIQLLGIIQSSGPRSSTWASNPCPDPAHLQNAYILCVKYVRLEWAFKHILAEATLDKMQPASLKARSKSSPTWAGLKSS